METTVLETTEIEKPAIAEKTLVALPQLGFLGVGWIGRNRMEAIANTKAGKVTFVADAAEANATEALKSAPDAQLIGSLEEMLQENIDAVVIATPSALHAEQSIAALEAGKAVFCQKPLGRTATETRAVVDAARTANKLLGVDLSYRHTWAMQQVNKVIKSGELGHIYAVELVFHNAYGPDKDWFYNPKLSGGGCVVDLGVHLVDLALWCLDFPEVQHVHSSLFSKGQVLTDPSRQVEDYASATISLASGTNVQLTCSWNLPAGQEAIIKATFYGTKGGVCFRNVGGSFYDFVAERYHGTRTETLCTPPDDWMGRAAVAWAQQLTEAGTFNDDAEEFVKVAEVLDRIYNRSMYFSSQELPMD